MTSIGIVMQLPLSKKYWILKMYKIQLEIYRICIYLIVFHLFTFIWNYFMPNWKFETIELHQWKYMYHVPNIVERRHYQKVGGREATCPRTRTVHPGECFISVYTKSWPVFSNYITVIYTCRLTFLEDKWRFLVYPHQIVV